LQFHELVIIYVIITTATAAALLLLLLLLLLVLAGLQAAAWLVLLLLLLVVCVVLLLLLRRLRVNQLWQLGTHVLQLYLKAKASTAQHSRQSASVANSKVYLPHWVWPAATRARKPHHHSPNSDTRLLPTRPEAAAAQKQMVRTLPVLLFLLLVGAGCLLTLMALVPDIFSNVVSNWL
jgi:hypothetical protein